jgi:flagellar biosynthesis protein FlhF
MAALRGMDVVLLDTAGRSQRDQDRLSELESTLAAAAPDHTLLVLSATVSEPVLNQAAERFMGLRPTGLVFTKLDEAVQIGPAVNTARKLAIGFCCLTDGQDVPDNIEPAHADRIAGLLLEAGEP